MLFNYAHTSAERLPALMAEIHADNKDKFWIDIHTLQPLNRDMEEALFLVLSELAEAGEGFRKDIMDDKLPHRKMAEVELADALIRIYDLIAGKGFTKRYHTDIPDFDVEFSAQFMAGIGGQLHPVRERPLAELMRISTMLSHAALFIRRTDPGDVYSAYLRATDGTPILRENGNPRDFVGDIATAVYAILRLARHHNFDLDGAIEEKLAYNRTRADHKTENRLKPGGKKV